MHEWKVDMNRLIELVARRMYSDPTRAGIRELITNSLDARVGDRVEIFIEYQNKSLRYVDNGAGIDPESFKEVYGKIASGHKRKKRSRGIFGIGRMSLIAASQDGVLVSYHQGKKYTWKFDKSGWEGPVKEEDRDDIGHGVFLQFNGIDLGNLDELKMWIRKTFSIPLVKKECEITFEYDPLFWLIQDDYLLEDPIKSDYGQIDLYVKEEMDGTLYICQKGILVREEPYTGLTAYIDQNFLDIKTDREGFINNEKYRYFKKVLKKELAKLRPQKSFEKMEVDFIKRLMKEFKRYWFKKPKINQVMEKLQIEFPKEEEMVIPKGQEVPKSVPEVSEPSPMPEIEPKEPESPTPYPQITPWGREIPTSTPEPIPIETPEKEIYPAVPEPTEDEPIVETETKVVKIRGAKPVDMGEDYPMIFYETEPFVLIFNTSHPVFKKLVEKGKLGSHQLAVLFERMFECAYSDSEGESQEDLKKRWKEVDKKLKEIFK